MDERTTLINKSDVRLSLNDESSIPKFISNSRLTSNQRFRWAIPSQENEEAHADRFFSIKICYVCMFFSAVSFTITISSMWPFLQIIDITTNTSFLGWIVSAFSIGQLIASPLFGYWANRISCHRIPIVTAIVITIFGNLIYSYLESTSHIGFLSPKYWMLLSRIIMGAGASCAAVIRSYVSTATNVQERTSVLANLSACQGLGFIIGPVLQAALVPIGFPGPVNKEGFHLNMYTSPAMLSILIYMGLCWLFMRKFNEYVVLDGETQEIAEVTRSNLYSINSTSSKLLNMQQQKSNANSYSESLKLLPPPDYVAIVLALILFFINCFIFSFYETLVSPLTIDMYAWSKSQSTLYNGIMLGGFGLFAVVIVLFSKILAKTYQEKFLMLVGYCVLLVAVVALLPWGHDYPSVEIPTIEPGHRNTTTSSSLNTTTITYISFIIDPPARGCPLNYDWCLYTPIVQLYQFLIGFALLVSGYSIANVMSFAIYSKLIGPRPQGTMMGILTSCGSTARAVGPIVVSYLYGLYVPRVSFITLAGIVILVILIIALTYKRYEPYKFS